jgi:hypothetical protein
LGIFDDEIEICRLGGEGKKQQKKPEHDARWCSGGKGLPSEKQNYRGSLSIAALPMHRIICDSSSGKGGGGARGNPDVDVFVWVEILDKVESARQTLRPVLASIN